MNTEEQPAAKTADPELEKIKKRLRWLRWKGDVLMREVRLIDRLRKSTTTKPS